MQNCTVLCLSEVYVRLNEQNIKSVYGSSSICQQNKNKKLRYRQGTARHIVSVEILPVAMQQGRNYLYDRSTPEEIEVMKLEG